MALNFSDKVPFILRRVFLTRRKILHGIAGFTFPPKEVMLQICIAIKISSSLARFERALPESNNKHNNRYSTEGVKLNMFRMVS
jgi:hypothetical protein